MSLRSSIVEHFVSPPADGPSPAPGDVARSDAGLGRAGADVARCDEGPDRACAEPAPRTPPGVAVLCRPADAQPLGSALGLALAGRRRAPVVAVCVWTGGPPGAGVMWRAPALPAARRLAAALAARGHDARAAGRLAVVRLPASPADAASDARRAGAAAGTAPVVLALGGPRVAAFDALLAEQDVVVIATAPGTDPALARLAVAGLGCEYARACVCEVPPAQPGRALAAAGLTLLPSARRALARAVEALS
jgi:hypothetical protein